MAKKAAPMGRTSTVTPEELIEAQQQRILKLEEAVNTLSVHLFRRKIV